MKKMAQSRKCRYKFSLTYEFELEKAIGDCATVLDVGCGAASPIRNFSEKYSSVAVDAFGQSVKESKLRKIHDEYVEMDVRRIGDKFGPGSFECVLALDLIEHLTKDEALEIINSMEIIASKRIVIFTPNGFLPQEEHSHNPLQIHKSGWSVNEMRRLGYRVIGINGWKPLRGKNASIKLWPKKIWKWIARRTQLIVRDRPELAFQILCIKDKVR